MTLMPGLSIGWLNGWFLLMLLVLTDSLLFLAFPKPVVMRLLDRSGWTQKQIVFTVISKLFAVLCVALIIFTPLKIGAPVFIVGTFVVAVGLSGLAKALFDFKNMPLDQPVSRGLYQVSRHPQIVMSSVVLLGACIAIGSWLTVFMLILARVFGHFSILAEEEVCLKQYGDAYRAYMKQVPRYFLFF